jgi:hypothetical protein
MNLTYILLGLNYDEYIINNNNLRFEFQKKVDFINDYLSKNVRKLRFKTDGTFNMISISLTEIEPSSTGLEAMNILNVFLPFDKNLVLYSDGIKFNNYCMRLLEIGFKKAALFKKIPLNDLLEVITEFKAKDFKNTWILKRKKIKEIDLEIILKCEFNSDFFQLYLIVNKVSIKMELVNGLIIKTKTGISIHEKMFNDIVVTKKEIIILDNENTPTIKISLIDVYDGIINLKIVNYNEIIVN